MCKTAAGQRAAPLERARFDSIKVPSGRFKGAVMVHVDASSTGTRSPHLTRKFLAAVLQGQRQLTPPQGSPGDEAHGKDPQAICAVESIFAAQVVAMVRRGEAR